MHPAIFEQWYDALPLKIFTASPNGSFDSVNPQWMEFVGAGFDRMLNWGWTDFLHPDDLQETLQVWKLAIAAGEPFQLQHRFRRADGVYRWHLTRAKAKRDPDGAIVKWVGANTEIHEQKEMEEELRRANADLNQFAYSASHDLQEPLRMVTSYAQLLIRNFREDRDYEEAEVCADFITSGIDRMRDLLSDLLAYKQLSADGPEPCEPVDLNHAFERAVENLGAAFDDSYAVATCDRLPVIRGHAVDFVQLFQNLISNAIKYRGRETPRIHASATELPNEWRIAVKDNGMGIEPEYHRIIFGLFKRLHGKSIPGTGIGLALCQRVVDRYHGRIWVESQPGEGSTFFFTLPRSLSEA